MICSGDLNERVEILSVAETPDGMGGHGVTEVSAGFRRANVAVPKARDNVLAMQGAVIRTHIVTMRANPAPPPRGGIILWRGERLRVLAWRPDFANGCVYLDCESDVPCLNSL